MKKRFPLKKQNKAVDRSPMKQYAHDNLQQYSHGNTLWTAS